MGKQIIKHKLKLMLVFLILVSFITPSLNISADTYQRQDFPTDFKLKGLSSPWNLTWQGNSSTAAVFTPVVTWCNGSGVRNETMEINLTVNATHGVEWVNISMGNLINTTNGWYVNSSNITLYISGDNVTYGLLQDDNGWGKGVIGDSLTTRTLTINETTWGVLIENPWMYHGDAGIINENCSIYVRFVCNLTIGLNGPPPKYGYYINQSTWFVDVGNGATTYNTTDFNGRLENGNLSEEKPCCLDTEIKVWNNDTGTWVDHYNFSKGDTARFNVSVHNCGDEIHNLTIRITNYDAISSYITGTGKLKLPNEAPVTMNPNQSFWEDNDCQYSPHGHLQWNISKSQLVNFTYCNYTYLEFNMTINSTNYSWIRANTTLCQFFFEYWDSTCNDEDTIYVNEKFNTNIECNCSYEDEDSEWAISEHIHRPCTEPECLDEQWFEYSTNYTTWRPFNTSNTESGNKDWNWTYRFEKDAEDDLDELNLSYTIANLSCFNRTMIYLRMRYNITDPYFEPELDTEPTIGIIYSFYNHSSFDMILYGENEMYLLSKVGNNLFNTIDGTPVTSKSNAHQYYDDDWPRVPEQSPYDIDPGDYGIWSKTIYNGLCNGMLQTKAWYINDTIPFGLEYEPSGWIFENKSGTRPDESQCFGLVVWGAGGDINFTADFDFIELFRLNYSRDPQANASELENHSIYGSDGIPLMYFPIYNKSAWNTSYYKIVDCYTEWANGNFSSQEFGDCVSCQYQNISDNMSMVSRAFNINYSVSDAGGGGPESTNEFLNQNDTIYYYTSILTNKKSFGYPYNNSMYIQIEDCTDGTRDDYDGALVCIDVDNNLKWDDNDMAFYWQYINGPIGWHEDYIVYNGTNVRYEGRTDEPPVGDMEIEFNIYYDNGPLGWQIYHYSYLPMLHRFSNHTMYTIDIPLYELEKGYVGSKDYLQTNDTFGLHIFTVNDDYEYSVAWENWNESNCSYYTMDDNKGEDIWDIYMNCSNWNRIVDFEDGTWNGTHSLHMQYWAHGRIGTEVDHLNYSLATINVTKVANVSIIEDIENNASVNYTITICNDGDSPVTYIAVNDTLPDCAVITGCSLPGINYTNRYGNVWVFNVTGNLGVGHCISFNITVNITEDCAPNGTIITNHINASAYETSTFYTNVSIQYGTNLPPIIFNPYPRCNRTVLSIPLLIDYMRATVEDPNGDTFSVLFYTNKTDTWNPEWNQTSENISVTNGTFYAGVTFNLSDRFNTKWRWGNTSYWWSVNVTDGNLWVNRTYEYKTDHSRYDVDLNGNVFVGDLSSVWANRGLGYLGLYDVDANDNIFVGDLSAIWANR